MKTILAHRASVKDPVNSFSYYTAQFPDLVFQSGDVYLFDYENGDRLTLTLSRNGTTFYLKDSKHQPHSQPCPATGEAFNHQVVAVYKHLKTAVKVKKAAKK